MKKIVALLLLSALILLPLTACGGDTKKPAGTDAGAAGEVATENDGKKLIIYTSMKESMISVLVADFAEKNPDIPLDYQSAGAGKLMAKIATERESGQIMADVIWTSEVPDFYNMKNEEILLQYRPEGADAVLNPLEGTDDYFIPARLGTLGIAYNSNIVKTAPTSWQDITGPDFKDAFAIANPSQSGTAFVSVAMLNKALGEQFFRDIRANGAIVGQGSGQVVDDTASGELSGCLAVDYITFDKINNGATLAMAFPEEMLVIPSPIAIFKDSQKPAAAKKFVDYMLTEDAQTIIANNGTLPVIPTVKVPAEYNLPPAEEALERAIKIDYMEMMAGKEVQVETFLNIMQG